MRLSILTNIEAEKALLGCLMLDNKLIEQTPLRIKTDDFYKEEHQRLYNEIIVKYSRNESVDIATLSSLKIYELTDIVNSCITTSNYNIYLKTVAELAGKRNFLKKFDDLKKNILEDETLEMMDIQGKALDIVNSVALNNASEETESFTEVILAALENLEKQFVGGDQVFRSWGLKWLDEKTGKIKPALTILAARPSVGKSAFALQAAVNVARQGGKVAFFSLEMPNEQNVHRILSSIAPIPKDYFDKPWTLNAETWEMIGKTAGMVSGLPLTFYDKCFTIEEIIYKCSQQKAKAGLDFVVIDYLQLLETSRNFKTTNDKMGYISRQIKKFQQQNELHILALSQLNRETERQQHPTLANLRDSGSLEQDADNVWFLSPVLQEIVESRNQTESMETYLILSKQRGAERNLMRKLKFYGKVQRFYEA